MIGGARRMVVRQRTDHADRVAELHLTPEDGSTLAPYIPGSHLAVRSGAKVNAYSLLDDGHRPTRYRIAVRRTATVDPESGSHWLHDNAFPGVVLETTSPRSAFAPVASAHGHLLLAAGIGITPILSHLHSARRWGRSTRALVGLSAPFGLLDELVAVSPGPVAIAHGRREIDRAVRDLMADQPVDTQIYACGPAGFLDLVRAVADELTLVPGRLHIEVFDAPAPDAGDPFTVSLAPGGPPIIVPSGTSLLHALDRQGLRQDRMCERGVCGRCEIGVTSGTVVHRDVVLGPPEHAAGTRMMPCVSRGRGHLVLDPSTLTSRELP